MPVPLFELSPNSRLIRQRLRTMNVDEEITYDELSIVVGAPVSGATSALLSAKRSLLRHERISFAVVRGVGLRRLNDTGVVATADRDIDRVRRTARRGALQLACVQDFTAMPAPAQLAYTTRMSIFTATAELNSDRGLKKVEAAVGGRAGELPIAETLRAFGGE